MRTLPELIIAPAGTRLPPPPSAADAGVEAWREQDGSVCALGRIDGDERWFWLLGAGSFRFGPAGDVVAVPEAGRDLEAVRDAYRRSVLPLVLQSRGLEVLHASAVRAPHGVVALCAVKETGKTTLAYALSRRGHPLWADDAVVVDASSSETAVLAHQLPFGMRLRPASAAFFGHAAADGAQGRAHVSSEAGEFGHAVPLAALYVLVRDDAVAAGAEVRFGTGLDRLPAILDAIERTFVAAPPATAAAAGAPRRAVGA